MGRGCEWSVLVGRQTGDVIAGKGVPGSACGAAFHRRYTVRWDVSSDLCTMLQWHARAWHLQYLQFDSAAPQVVAPHHATHHAAQEAERQGGACRQEGRLHPSVRHLPLPQSWEAGGAGGLWQSLLFGRMPPVIVRGDACALCAARLLTARPIHQTAIVTSSQTPAGGRAEVAGVAVASRRCLLCRALTSDNRASHCRSALGGAS